MSGIIVGIDLGTTNSEVAVVRDGRPEVLAVEGGSRLLPSVVGLDDAGGLLVGEAARNQYVLHPERTVRSIKRRMGSDERVSLGGESYSPQEISAMILRRIKAVAEGHLGAPVTRAVITVPAYFSDAQRQATREAGEIAGLEVVRILNEPTAAALAYEVGREEPRRILVYDLGGGTFDVSVVSMAGEVVEVLASHGNNRLGGDDFDQKIVERIIAALRDQGADPAGSPQAMARILRAAEAAKITLSERPFALIEEPYLLERDGAPIHLSLELSRNDYEELIAPFIDETLEAVHIALKGAALTVADLDEILLVGGATRTPLVARRLEEALGIAPRSEIDPELCVAAGAAIQGALIAGARVDTVLVDITPYTFGTSAFDELNGDAYPFCFVPIIRKNTPIPVSRSEVFFTMVDGQEKVQVNVYQGEDPDALNNTEIGSFFLEGLKDAPAGNPLVTTFSLDLDGILHVTSREKATGLERSIRIDNVIGRFAEEEMAAARERVGRLFEGSAPAGDGAQAERSLIDKARRLMEGASGDDREDLVNGIEAVEEALAAGDAAALNDAKAALGDLIYYLES